MKKGIALLLSLLLLLAVFPAQAFAARPEGPEGETILPSNATELDRSQYVDGSAWDNPPIPNRKVRVGLKYGDYSVVQAEMINVFGGAFDVGWYDEALNFYPAQRIYCSDILIACALDTENGMMILDASDLSVLFLTGPSAWLAVVPAEGEEYGITEYYGHQYHGGFICSAVGDWLLSVVNVVDLETYVKGVVPYEMNRSFPYEALRAQAVCARTYMLYNLGAYSQFGFDLTDNAECQVYGGILAADETTDRAVESTAGQVIRYRGEIAEIYYSAADGGATEDGGNVFRTDAPYLRGKFDPFEMTIDYPLKSWEVVYDGEQLAGMLYDRWGTRCGKIVEVKPTFSEHGNVLALDYYDTKGEHYHTEGRECYTALYLNSARFTVTQDKDGQFVFTGSGLGHNCGMSQWGAYAMAQNFGYDCEDIIRFYFTGVYIA